MYYDKVEKQKRIVAKAQKYHILLLIMGGLLFIPFLWAAFYDLRALLIVWIPLALMLISVKWIAENNCLIKQLTSIAENNAFRMIRELTLDHPKLSFKVHPGTHSRAASQTICAIVFRVSRQKKYYYFFDESVTLSCTSVEIKRMKACFEREVHIQCYADTAIIRTVENDPRYLHRVFEPSGKSIFD